MGQLEINTEFKIIDVLNNSPVVESTGKLEKCIKLCTFQGRMSVSTAFAGSFALGTQTI